MQAILGLHCTGFLKISDAYAYAYLLTWQRCTRLYLRLCFFCIYAYACIVHVNQPYMTGPMGTSEFQRLLPIDHHFPTQLRPSIPKPIIECLFSALPRHVNSLFKKGFKTRKDWLSFYCISFKRCFVLHAKLNSDGKKIL